jgi:type II secretory ATPase GspE/PulE/Tfp pilus assembly ATPase PilB-like protein
MGLFSSFTKKDEKKDEKKVQPDSASRPVDPMNELAAPVKGMTRGNSSQTAVPRSAGVAGEEAAPLSPARRGFVPSREDAAAFNERRRSGKALQLSRVLENTGLMTEEQIDALIRTHGESATTLKRAVESQGLMKEVDFTKALAESLRMEHISISDVEITPDLIARVDKKLAKEYRVFPVGWDEAKQELRLAISDPLNIGAIDDLQRILKVKTHPLVASEEEIERAYKKWYEVDKIQGVYMEATEDLHRKEQATFDQYTTVDLVGDDANQPAVVKFVDLIFRQAVHDRASDIHIEPSRNAVAIRFRVDGVLHELPAPPKKWQNAIISRIKVLSGMDLAEKRIPQDGRIKLNLPDRKLDLRVSSLPAIYGESVVMRILDQNNVMLGLEDVGFLPENVSLFRTLISSPNGVILMTGPTGSGKTTTLYSALGVLNNPETKIITVENPVEYMIDGINQVQVNEELGLTFSKALRSMLRQSPDVILVGEIRDKETAEIAVRAALTGHLVFSTLHTNDAPSAPTRLVDMGIKPFLVASAVQAAIAQRLIRKLCIHCKVPVKATPETVQEAGGSPDDVANAHMLNFMGPQGCDRCEGKGYRGRTAIHEIFVLDSRMRNYIIRGESATRLKKIAVKNGMRSLRMDGYEKAKLGFTSLEEVMRITQQD